MKNNFEKNDSFWSKCLLHATPTVTYFVNLQWTVKLKFNTG